MAETVYTPDGGYRIIFDDRDAIDIVIEYAGQSVANHIKGIIQCNEVKQTELDNLQDQVFDCENQMMEAEDAFREIVRICRDFRFLCDNHVPSEDQLKKFVESVCDVACEMI